MNTLAETIRLYEKAAEINSNKGIRLRQEEKEELKKGNFDMAFKKAFEATEAFNTRNKLFQMINEIRKKNK